MTSPAGPTPAPDAEPDFDTAQQRLMEEIGQTLIGQSTSGTVALELVAVRDVASEHDDLTISLTLERQSGLTVPAAADQAVTEIVQRLALLWQAHGRAPWRTFTYRLTRGESGPRFTCEFEV
jgi:hypothetical protein